MEPDVTDRLRVFAADAGAVLCERAPKSGVARVMDLAINQDSDEVVPIGLNPGHNAGAPSCPSAWMGAVREGVVTAG